MTYKYKLICGYSIKKSTYHKGKILWISRSS
jgi:hypothetical protein